MLSKFFFLVSESLKGLFRAKVPALISSITISISLIILSVAIFAYYNFIGLTKSIKSEFAIEVFFDQNIALNEATELYNKILLIDGIEQGYFIDKKEASAIFKKHFNENIEDILGENPLPMGANYIISMSYRSYDSIKEIIFQINRFKGVEDVLFQKDTIIKINRIIELTLSAGFLIGVFILFISIILVSNTIRLIIYSKKDTIEILKLLGATDIFIKFPFILEGIIQGLIGSIISIVSLFILNSLQMYFIESIINL